MEDRDQRAKDDLAACRRENNRLRDQLSEQLMSERQRDPWEELRHQKAKDDLAACRRENNRLRDQLKSKLQRDEVETAVLGIGYFIIGVM